MKRLNTELRQALRERDEAKRLLASLDQLSSDESISEADRLALEQDYRERLRDADAAIERMRDAIREHFRSAEQDLKTIGQDRATLQVRHKVGELDLNQYQKASDDLRARQTELERQKAALQKLLDAKSEADVAGVPVPRARSTAPATALPTGSSRPTVPMVAGLSGRWVKLASGALIAVGAIAVVALLVQAGAPGLPSIPSPFGGDDGSTADAGPSDTTPAAGESDGTSSGDTVPVDVQPGEVASTETDFDLPLELTGATDIGSLHAEVTYDETELEVLSVTAGALPPDAMFQFGVSDGRVALGFVSTAGLDGDMTAAVLRFRVLSGTERAGDSRFGVENVVAHNALTLVPVATMPGEGRVNLFNLSVGAAAVGFV